MMVAETTRVQTISPCLWLLGAQGPFSTSEDTDFQTEASSLLFYEDGYYWLMQDDVTLLSARLQVQRCFKGRPPSQVWS